MGRSSRDSSSPRGDVSNDIPSGRGAESNDTPSDRGAESNEEPLSKWAEKQFRNREYQRRFYHAHSKKPVECEIFKKIYSSISALRRRRRNNLHCRLIQFENAFNAKTT